MNSLGVYRFLLDCKEHMKLMLTPLAQIPQVLGSRANPNTVPISTILIKLHRPHFICKMEMLDHRDQANNINEGNEAWEGLYQSRNLPCLKEITPSQSSRLFPVRNQDTVLSNHSHFQEKSRYFQLYSFPIFKC